MKRIFMIAFAALIPLAAFAQVQGAQGPDREAELFKALKLSDAQVAQVKTIQDSTFTELQKDSANIQLISAQIHVARIADNPDLAAIDKLIDQRAQLRATEEKTLLAAQQQLVQILGKDGFREFFRLERGKMGAGNLGMPRMRERMGEQGQGPEGMAPMGELPDQAPDRGEL